MSFPARDGVIASLKKIFDEAGPDRDMSKVKSVPGGPRAVMARIQALNVELEQLNRIQRDVDRAGPGSFEGEGSEATFVAGLRGDGLRAIANSRVHDEAKQKATVMVESDKSGLAARWAAATADPAYRTAFAKVVANPERGHLEWSDREQSAYSQVQSVRNAMGNDPDGSGGFMTPFELDPAVVITSSGSVNPVRRVARVIPTVSDVWHGISSDGVTAEWLAEAAEAADASPTVAQPSIASHKAAAWVPFSIEFGADVPSLVEELAMLLVDGKEQLEGAALINGSGSGQPFGVVTALTGGSSVVAPTTSETFTAVADCEKTLEAVGARFRENATFLAHLNTIHAIANDLGGGAASNKPMILDMSSTPMRLLNKPLYEASFMEPASGIDDAATDVTNRILLAGDFRRGYYICDRVGTTIEIVPHLMGSNQRPTGQRGAWMFSRVGADTVADGAFALLNIETAA